MIPTSRDVKKVLRVCRTGVLSQRSTVCYMHINKQ